MKPKSIYKMILEGDDIRWQTVIYELVRSRKIDPWNLDISILTREYLKILRNLERLNFKLSGKVVLAAALLLKLKTRELGLTEFIQHTEGMFDEEEMEIEVDSEEVEEEQAIAAVVGRYAGPQLLSKIPQIRTRPVTVFELMDALKKAISVQSRRQTREDQRIKDATPIKHQLRKIDIYKKISRVYNKLQRLAQETNSQIIEFNSLISTENSNGKIWTFVPLLHLANEERVNLHQDLPFGKIFVELKSEN